MTMDSGNSRDGRVSNMVMMWIVSLGISVFCCTVFSALVAFYVSDIGKTLIAINERLGRLEGRSMVMMTPVIPPRPAAPARRMPSIVAPPAAAPAVAPEPVPVPVPGAPGTAPSAAAPSGIPSFSGAGEEPSAPPAPGAGAPESIVPPGAAPAAP